MRIVHRIGFRATDLQRRELEALGVTARVPKGTSLPGDNLTFVAFDVAEDHPNWSQIRALLQQWGISEGAVRTEFSKKEIDSAPWLEIGAWHHGYPQPDEDVFGYLQATYDLTDWCDACDIGRKQKAPFQMKGEPKWGKNGILQLVWVYDEMFAKPEVWASIFKPHGIECRSVMNTKGVELKTVVQLVAREEVGIVTDGLSTEQAACLKCGRTKYLPVTRGRFPALTGEPSVAMVKTKAYFGSGASAHKGVLVSQAIARALATNKIHGASLRPVAERNGGS